MWGTEEPNEMLAHTKLNAEFCMLAHTHTYTQKCKIAPKDKPTGLIFTKL